MFWEIQRIIHSKDWKLEWFDKLVAYLKDSWFNIISNSVIDKVRIVKFKNLINIQHRNI